MDSLTHIAIGACIGDLFLGKKIGKKAMAYGALAASLPDIDFIASFWMNTPDELLAHRGFTHSILFAILAVIGLAFLFRHRHRVENIPVRVWLVFLGTEIFIHLFLDAFNAYGVGWFEPFNHTRISFNTIFVADPFFSIWPGIAAIGLLVRHVKNPKRRLWAKLGLIGCSMYLFYCMTNKYRIDRQTRFALLHQGIHYKRYFTTPTSFNDWLWYDVVEADSGFYLGYRSIFDKTDHIDFRYVLKNDSLLTPFQSEHDLQQLIRFSQGYYTADTSTQGIVFNDLRFGQIMGWQDPGAHFVFHYYLRDSTANNMVVQRGRFANWNWKNVKLFVKRIEGVDR
jgi:inner membrane protein